MSVGQTCPTLEKSADSFSLKNSASSGEKLELLAWFFDPIPTKPAKSLLQALFSFFFPLMVRTAQDAPVFYGKFASQSSHYEADGMPCEFWHSCMVGEVC
jgi:hypothetical protein